MLLTIYAEYAFNYKLIHNYSPDSIVAAIGEVVGNYGLLFYSLVSISFLLNKKNANFLFSMNLDRITNVMYVYFFVYSFVALGSYFSTYGSLMAANSVNGHTYHLVGIALLIFLFSFLSKKVFSVKYQLLFLYNLILVLLIFKTRGVLLISLFLFLFSVRPISISIKHALEMVPFYKVLAVASFFVIYILLFATTVLTDYQSSSGSLEILSKEGTGKRDVAIMQWFLYLYSSYVDNQYIEVPLFTPHSTYPGMLGYLGITYTVAFVALLLNLFHCLFQKKFPPPFSLLVGGLGILISVSFISPLSYFYFIFAIIIMIRVSDKLPN